jgi:hypothetical protein
MYKIDLESNHDGTVKKVSKKFPFIVVIIPASCYVCPVEIGENEEDSTHRQTRKFATRVMSKSLLVSFIRWDTFPQ